MSGYFNSFLYSQIDVERVWAKSIGESSEDIFRTVYGSTSVLVKFLIIFPPLLTMIIAIMSIIYILYRKKTKPQISYKPIYQPGLKGLILTLIILALINGICICLAIQAANLGRTIGKTIDSGTDFLDIIQFGSSEPPFVGVEAGVELAESYNELVANDLAPLREIVTEEIWAYTTSLHQHLIEVDEMASSVFEILTKFEIPSEKLGSENKIIFDDSSTEIRKAKLLGEIERIEKSLKSSIPSKSNLFDDVNPGLFFHQSVIVSLVPRIENIFHKNLNYQHEKLEEAKLSIIHKAATVGTASPIPIDIIEFFSSNFLYDTRFYYDKFLNQTYNFWKPRAFLFYAILLTIFCSWVTLTVFIKTSKYSNCCILTPVMMIMILLLGCFVITTVIGFYSVAALYTGCSKFNDGSVTKLIQKELGKYDLELDQRGYQCMGLPMKSTFYDHNRKSSKSYADQTRMADAVLDSFTMAEIDIYREFVTSLTTNFDDYIVAHYSSMFQTIEQSLNEVESLIHGLTFGSNFFSPSFAPIGRFDVFPNNFLDMSPFVASKKQIIDVPSYIQLDPTPYISRWIQANGSKEIVDLIQDDDITFESSDSILSKIHLLFQLNSITQQIKNNNYIPSQFNGNTTVQPIALEALCDVVKTQIETSSTTDVLNKLESSVWWLNAKYSISHPSSFVFQNDSKSSKVSYDTLQKTLKMSRDKLLISVEKLKQKLSPEEKAFSKSFGGSLDFIQSWIDKSVPVLEGSQCSAVRRKVDSIEESVCENVLPLMASIEILFFVLSAAGYAALICLLWPRKPVHDTNMLMAANVANPLYYDIPLPYYSREIMGSDGNAAYIREPKSTEAFLHRNLPSSPVLRINPQRDEASPNNYLGEVSLSSKDKTGKK